MLNYWFSFLCLPIKFRVFLSPPPARSTPITYFRRYSSLDAYVEDLLYILDAHTIDRCTYVGHSVSSTIGILASIKRPQLFTKLILVGFSPRSIRDFRYEAYQFAKHSATISVLNRPRE